MNERNDEHAWVREQLEGYLAGGLPAGERVRIERHLTDCTPCRTAWEEVRAFDRRLAGAFASGRPPEGFEDRILARVRTEGRRRRFSILRFVPRGRPAAVTAAAAFFFALGITLSSADSGRMGGWSETALAPSETPAERFVSGVRGLFGEGVRGLFVEGDRAPPATGGEDTEDTNELLGLDDDQLREIRRNHDAGAGRDGIVAGLDALRRIEGNYDSGRTSRGQGGQQAGRPAGDGYNDRWGQADGRLEELRQMQEKLEEEAGPRTEGHNEVYGELAAGQSGQGSGGGSSGMAGGMRTPSAPMVENRLAINRLNEAQRDYQYADLNKEDWSEHGYYTLDSERDEAGQASAAPPQGSARLRNSAAEMEAGERRGTLNRRNDATRPGEDTPADEPQPRETPATQTGRVIIRNGEMEFEVDSYDSALLQIGRIAAEEDGFIATTDSERLENGKVRGTVIVRVPPGHLDALVMKLRALGDLVRQQIRAQDITKQYYDLESRLRAARAMQETLLELLRRQDAAVEHLLEVERELGRVRTEIEQYEGEIRYFQNLVSLSTLTITLQERDLARAHRAVRTETADMGIEADDVETSYRAALDAIREAEGRVLRSNLRRLDAGQMHGEIACELEADRFGATIDRFKLFGKVTRLDIRQEETVDGEAPAGSAPLQVVTESSRINLSLYNIANIAPRETIHEILATREVESVFRAVVGLARGTEGGRVVSSQLDRENAERMSGRIHFEIPAAAAGTVRERIEGMGEVIHVAVSENPDTRQVTDSKVGFQVRVQSLATVPPRETVTLSAASDAVEPLYRRLRERVESTGGRVIQAAINRTDGGNASATLHVEIPATEQAAWEEILAEAETIARDVHRASDDQRVTESKVAYRLGLQDLSGIPTRETVAVLAAATDVRALHERLRAQAEEAGGRVIHAQIHRQEGGRVSGELQVLVPAEQRNAWEGILDGSAEILTRNVQRLSDTQRATASKVRFHLSVVDLAIVPARETVQVDLVASDVERTYEALRNRVVEGNGRVRVAQLQRNPGGNASGTLEVEIPTALREAFEALLADAEVNILSRNVARTPEGNRATDSKILYRAGIISLMEIQPRRIVTLSLETRRAQEIHEEVVAAAREAEARLIEWPLVRNPDGSYEGTVAFDLSAARAAETLRRIEAKGDLRGRDDRINPSVPAGTLAKARVIVEIRSPAPIVSDDAGIGTRIRSSISQSLAGLLFGMEMIVVGLAWSLPFLAVGGGLWWGFRRRQRNSNKAA